MLKLARPGMHETEQTNHRLTVPRASHATWPRGRCISQARRSNRSFSSTLALSRPSHGHQLVSAVNREMRTLNKTRLGPHDCGLPVLVWP